MRRFLTAILITAGATSTTALAVDVTAAAAQTGTIQPAGPRQNGATDNNGDRFFNVEGSSFGVNSSYGVARWDLTATRANLDTMFGAGNWFVAGVDLRLTQSNAGFTTDGGVKVYYTTDDATDCKTPASPLMYPFEDPPGVTDLPVALADPLSTYNFVEVATGTVDSYAIYRNENSGQRNALASDIETQNALTLVLLENDATVAATYAGQTPDAGQFAPELRIRAVQTGGNIAPYANAGPDQADEDLDGNGLETIALNGTGSVDLDGTIANPAGYVWREGTTQIATGATPSPNLTVGVHTITLTVTDNGGATDVDTMVVSIVAGPVPTANAGVNQEVIDTDNNGSQAVTLDGSGSSDVDGTLVNYEWREGSTVLGSGPSPTLNVNFPLGAHTIKLIVTDDDTQTDLDFVQVDVRPGNIIAGHNFDDVQMYTSFTPVPDTNSTPFGSAGDGFGIYQRFVSTSIPFSMIDDTVTNFPTDALGPVKSKKLDNWFGSNDLQNPSNTSGLGTITWTFDIAGQSNLQLRIDVAAMGDWEATGTMASVADSYVWSYSIDGGGSTTVFSCLPDEAQDNVPHEMESGSPVSLSDPLVVNGTTRLSNSFETLTANIAGTGNQLTLVLAASNDSDEAYIFDNIYITTGGGAPECSCVGDIVGSGPGTEPNGLIDLADLTVFLSNYGRLPDDPCIDFNDSGGPIDINDLSALLGAYGRPCP
jgi:hypothetical protein